MEVKRRTITSLVSKLSSVSEQTRYEALSELRFITKNYADTRPIIADTGAIPYLAETLYSSSHSFRDDAAATLLNLSISCRQSLISARGLLDAMSHALRQHRSTTSAFAVQSSAATLHSLLVADEYRSIIGSKRDILYSLIDILKTPSSPPRSIKDSLKALFGIALYPLNRSSLVELGAVPALFSLVVKDGPVGIVEDATAVVAQVAGCEDSEEAFIKVNGVIVLVDLLEISTGSSLRTKENAVSGMLNLGRCGGEKMVKEVRKLGVGVVDGILDVAEHGSAKGKTKAVALLKLVDLNGRSGVVRNSRISQEDEEEVQSLGENGEFFLSQLNDNKVIVTSSYINQQQDNFQDEKVNPQYSSDIKMGDGNYKSSTSDEEDLYKNIEAENPSSLKVSNLQIIRL